VIVNGGNFAGPLAASLDLRKGPGGCQLAVRGARFCSLLIKPDGSMKPRIRDQVRSYDADLSHLGATPRRSKLDVGDRAALRRPSGPERSRNTEMCSTFAPSDGVTRAGHFHASDVAERDVGRDSRKRERDPGTEEAIGGRRIELFDGSARK